MTRQDIKQVSFTAVKNAKSLTITATEKTKAVTKCDIIPLPAL